MIFPACPTPASAKALLAQAHERGRQCKSVVGLCIAFVPVDSNEEFETVGTGVFIGTTEDGRSGLILTCAHLWFPEGLGRKSVSEIRVNFGAENRFRPVAGMLQVLGTRVIFPPNHRSGYDPNPEACPTLIPAIFDKVILRKHTDMALVEFPMEPALAEALAGHGFQAARFYDDPRLRKPLVDGEPLLEGWFAGFGRPGFRDQPMLLPRAIPKVHAGDTLVGYDETGSVPCFSQVSPWTPSSGPKRPIEEYDPEENDSQFEPAPRAQTWWDLYNRAWVEVQTHPEQACMASGDSGGPLYLQDGQGDLLAGIASHVEWPVLTEKGGKGRKKFLMQRWVAIHPYLPWIAAVRQGDLGSLWVMTKGVPAKEPTELLKAAASGRKRRSSASHAASSPSPKVRAADERVRSAAPHEEGQADPGGGPDPGSHMAGSQ